MANLSSLVPLTTAATALSNLILVSPQKTIGYQPQNPPNEDGTPSTLALPPALLFHYEGEQTASLESDITDHYIEDNTAIADQISLKPEIITTKGYIGELNDIPPAALALAKTLTNKLITIGAYTPVLTAAALEAYSQAFQLYQVGANLVNSAVSTWESLSGTGGESVINGQGLALQKNQSRQQVAFQQFYGYWRQKTLFTVQTPWAIFQNMAIKNLRAIQDAETNVISDFEVTFKMIRTASTQFALAHDLAFQGRLQFQGAGLRDFGTQTPSPSLGLDTQLGSSAPGVFPGI